VYISDTLLSKLKVKISLPDGSFEDDQDLLDFAHLALLSDIVPELIKSREDYYVKSTTLTLTSSGTVRIPSRAFGGNVREIKLIDPATGKYSDLDRINEEEFDDPTSTGRPSAFCVRGNRLVFNVLPDQTYSLFVTYWLNPPRIVASAECARVTAVNGDTISCTPVSSWTSSNRFDIVKGTSDYEPVMIDQTASSVNADSIVFATAPSDIEVGDWICLAGESPYAYLQDSYYPVLLQFAVSQIHESKGDDAQKTASDKKAEAMLKRIAGVYVDRVQGAPIKIKSSLL
jgi:hypothetical protein